MNGISEKTWENLSTDQKIDVLHDYVKDIHKEVRCKRTLMIGAVGGVTAVVIMQVPTVTALIAGCF